MNKILVLTSTFPRWEHDTEPPFVFELCKKLAQQFEVHILAPHCPKAVHFEIMQSIKVTRFSYFIAAGENLCYQGGMLAKLKQNSLYYLLIPFFLFFQLRAAYKIIEQENIVLIHAHWIIPQGITAYMLRLLVNKPIKILCTSHGGDLFSLKGFIARFLKQKILQSMDGITVVNSIMKQEVHTLCASQNPRVDIIPMGVDLHIFTPQQQRQRSLSLLFVGRIVEKKGLEYLINALPEIVRHFPKAHLTIIGIGPQKQRLETQVQEKQLDKHVAFLGAIANTELPNYYQQHQIAIFPFIVADNGDREGLPVVVSEAIACGCCVITTDLPGINDIVSLGQGVLTVTQKNSQAIVNEVLRLFYNPEEISINAKTALAVIAKKQSWDVIGQQYTDLINSLIHPKAC